MRRERSMRRLEDPKGRASHLIAAAEHELSEAVAMDGHGRQVADDLAGSGQRDRLIGLEADDADEWRGVRPGQDLREQPGLAAARLADDERGTGPSIVTRLPDEGSDLRSFPPTPDERRAHGSKVNAISGRSRCPRRLSAPSDEHDEASTSSATFWPRPPWCPFEP